MTILRIYDRNTIELDYEYDTIWELFYDMYRSLDDDDTVTVADAFASMLVRVGSVSA